MYILWGILAVIFAVLGFVGIVGGVVAIVFWVLAGLCVAALVKTFPRDRKGPNHPPTHAP